MSCSIYFLVQLINLHDPDRFTGNYAANAESSVTKTCILLIYPRTLIKTSKLRRQNSWNKIASSHYLGMALSSNQQFVPLPNHPNPVQQPNSVWSLNHHNNIREMNFISPRSLHPDDSKTYSKSTLSSKKSKVWGPKTILTNRNSDET
jgi:hypothetical protein